MSYDIRLEKDGKTVELSQKHDLKGGIYTVGGTTSAELNVTYNYAPHYYRIFGDKGIRTIYGMTAADSIPVLLSAIRQLKDEATADYWEASEGNARRALVNLVALAASAPVDSVWMGD